MLTYHCQASLDTGNVVHKLKMIDALRFEMVYLHGKVHIKFRSLFKLVSIALGLSTIHLNVNVIYLIGGLDGFSIMTSFFAEYVHTDQGATCIDVDGFRYLSTAQECKDAVRYAKTIPNSQGAPFARYEHELDTTAYPKGCIMVEESIMRGSMYFNSHPLGGGDYSVYRSICKKRNT